MPYSAPHPSCHSPSQPALHPPTIPSLPGPLTAAVLALFTLCPVAQAQTQTQTTPPAPAQVVITGNPLGNNTGLQPSAVLAGDGLALRRAGTLGDTLSGLVGVAATGFGPQASRPVIRGLDGDRIRLLDNGGASADASNLSFDHAVAVDPLVVERIEVLRGPAALLYGGNATGGVINTLDNRIPRSPLSGLSGRAAYALGGAADERAASALLEGGGNGLNWHVDAAQRHSADLQTPRFVPVKDGVALPATTRVANSGGDSQAAALGGSWAGPQGFVGLAYDDYRNTYGTTVEPDVTIRMQRQRTQAAAEWRGGAGPLSSLSLQASHTRYQHQEVEGTGAVGTTFRSQGNDLRLQATQAPLHTAWGPLSGVLSGVLGVQAETLDFSALGAEAFVPTSHTRSAGVFVLQQLALDGLTLSAGGRLEQVRVASEGDAADPTNPAAPPHFGAALARRFSPRSLSLGMVAPLPTLGLGWTASATLGQTQRAPAYYELFANGLHVATGAYERGDLAQALERSRHLELGLQWRQGPNHLRAALFATRFANYIALDASGQTVAVNDGAGGTVDIPEYRFIGVPAQMVGFEIEGRQRLRSAPWQIDASAGLDSVRGHNTQSGEPLPRIAPLRLQLGVDAAQAAWRLGAQLKLVARQNQVSAGDIATAGSAQIDLWASWAQRLGGGDALWTVKLTNLGNAQAYNAVALRTARALAPAGGRALSAGLRWRF